MNRRSFVIGILGSVVVIVLLILFLILVLEKERGAQEGDASQIVISDSLQLPSQQDDG